VTTPSLSARLVHAFVVQCPGRPWIPRWLPFMRENIIIAIVKPMIGFIGRVVGAVFYDIGCVKMII